MTQSQNRNYHVIRVMFAEVLCPGQTTEVGIKGWGLGGENIQQWT